MGQERAVVEKLRLDFGVDRVSGVEKHAAIKHLRRGTSSWSDRDDSVGTF
jgi:hypothetical protein